MPPGTTNIFNATPEQFREWERGDRITDRSHLNDVPSKLNKERRVVGPGAQVVPEAKGTGAGTAVQGDTSWKTDVHFIFYEHVLDGLRCFRHSVFEEQADLMPWRVMKPYPLRRTPFETVGNSQYDGRYHTYQSHNRRQVTDVASPQNTEWQRIIPRWVPGDIITAKRVTLGNDEDKVFKRTGAGIFLGTRHTAYTDIAISAAIGQGDELPAFENWAVLNIQGQGKPSAEAQIYEFGSANPAAYLAHGHELEVDPDHPLEWLIVDITWSWRWQADADGRAWTREHGQG